MLDVDAPARFVREVGLVAVEHHGMRTPTEGGSMRNLMVDFIISLDGYGAAEGWPGYWGMEGPEYWGGSMSRKSTRPSWERRPTG